ncbi:MAG: ComEC/Rec2 family competence protein, partial [Alphaproteobacteria bacterium]
VMLMVERTRLAATDQILEALPEPTDGVAAALLTGHRSAVPADQLETIRMAGLAHLLAISGLHLGLVTAIFFFVIRAFLATLEPVALRFPIKTWAALGAMLGAFCYLLISGATVPTQRAFLMAAIVLIAVAIGRQAISLRLVALAAIAVMVISPHVVTGASFQLSFAAVIGLVAVYEALKDQWPRWRVAQGPFSRLVLYVGGVALTTIVANFATGPLVLAQFGRFATYGLFSNLIAVPLTAFWIMPWGLLSLFLMPLGLEGLGLVPMGWGIDLVLIVAEQAANAPYSQVHVSAAPGWVPAVFGLGLVWLCIWRSRWRALGFAPMVAALIVTFLARAPDVLVHGDADLVAVRISDDEVAFSTLRRGKFLRESWLGAMVEPSAVTWPTNGLELDENTLRCDSLGCIYRPPDSSETQVGIELGVAALADDCGVADLIISLVPIRRECFVPMGTIDRFDLWRYGTHALWFDTERVRIETVREERGERPWSPGPEDED